MILWQLLTQTFTLALEQLWANRFRAALTMLGIVIGVASTVAIIGGTVGLKKFVLKEIESFGTNRFVVFSRNPRQTPMRFSPQRVQIRLSEARAIARACPSIGLMSPVKSFSAEIRHADRKETVRVAGVNEVWHEIESREIKFGRPFTRIDQDQRLGVCLVNDKAVDELALPSDPTGRDLLIDGRRFRIVGLIETKQLPGAFGGGGEPLTEVYIPFATADAMKPEPVYGIYIQGTMKEPTLAEDVKAEVGQTLRRLRGLGPDDPDTFVVYIVEEFVAQVEKVSTGLTIAATGIVGISLLVGGIGIMNIMLASVSERTREIGLRKAVGARPGVILAQFLVEAVVLCLIGAGVGIVLGYALVYAVRSFPGSPMEGAAVPAWAIALAVGFSGATGVIFGMFPALKAARLDPIEALRHE